MKLCKCGCKNWISDKDNWGRNHDYVHGHRDRIKYPNKVPNGEEHYNYKRGWHIKNGYKVIRVDNHPRANKSNRYAMMEHVIIMEKYLGRYLTPDELVHHINGNKLDNRIENLEIVNRPKHAVIHYHERDAKTGRFLR